MIDSRETAKRVKVAMGLRKATAALAARASAIQAMREDADELVSLWLPHGVVSKISRLQSLRPP